MPQPRRPFSSLEWAVLSRHELENTRQAQAVVLDCYYGLYNHERRHNSAGMMSRSTTRTPRPRPGSRTAKPSTIRGAGTTLPEVDGTVTSLVAQEKGHRPSQFNHSNM